MRATIKVKVATDTVPIRVSKRHSVFKNGMRQLKFSFENYNASDYFHDGDSLLFRYNLRPGDIIIVYAEDL